MKLFKICVKASSVFSKYYLKNLKPFYVISKSKEDALEYMNRTLKSDVKIKSISYLGDELSLTMFHNPKIG